MTIHLRGATTADLPSATEVQRRAFEAARGGEPADDIVEGIDAVQDDDESFGLVAVDGDAVVGHVQFSRASAGTTPVLILGPLGVMPDSWGRGIGSSLVAAGLDEARARGEIAAIVLGDPAFYGRTGFVPASRFGLRNPRVGVQPNGFVIAEEHLQIAPLGPTSSLIGGDVAWHPALG